VFDSSPPATIVRPSGLTVNCTSERGVPGMSVIVTRPVAVSVEAIRFSASDAACTQRPSREVASACGRVIRISCSSSIVKLERRITPSALGGFTAVIERPT
jgi:hypothetical protein